MSTINHAWKYYFRNHGILKLVKRKYVINRYFKNIFLVHSYKKKFKLKKKSLKHNKYYKLFNEEKIIM